MAFWALGKVKNLSQKLNLNEYKEIGSKIIKNYMNTEDQNEQFFDFAHKPSFTNQNTHSTDKQNLSEAEWLQIQIEQYKKLSKLQERLLKAHQEEEEQRLAKECSELQKQLEELSKEEEAEMQEIEKQKLKAEIKLGQKNITELIRENISMREEIQKRRITN